MNGVTRCTILLGLIFLPGVAARAGLIINVGSTSLNAGETKSVDVLFSATGDSLQAFGYRLQLDAPANGLLRLVNPPTNSELSLGNYVFAGDSDAATNGSIASVSTSNTTDDTFDTADITISGMGINVTNTNDLLVRLDITALVGATPGTFNLNFVDAFSAFGDANGDPIAFTSNFGTVTVNSVSAVPEPSSLALLAAASVCMMGRRWRQRKLDARVDH